MHFKLFACATLTAVSMLISAQETRASESPPSSVTTDAPIVWQFVLPTQGLRSPTTTAIAAQVASEFPKFSQFGPLRDGTREYSDIAISAAGARQSGLLYTHIGGTRARQEGNIVVIEYVSGKRKADGREVVSISRSTLAVNSDASDPTKFRVSTSTVDEIISYDILFFKQRSLAPVDVITTDIFSTLHRIKVTLPYAIPQIIKVDADFPPASVYANYERAFGKSIGGENKEQNMDTRFGIFSVQNNRVSVGIAPYRNGSKVTAIFSIQFELASDGTSTYQPESAGEIANIVRATASQ